MAEGMSERGLDYSEGPQRGEVGLKNRKCRSIDLFFLLRNMFNQPVSG